MHRDLITQARLIAGELRSTEDGCDAALANNARLVATLLDVRRRADLPAATGRDALESAIRAISYAAKARAMVLDTHQALKDLDLRELATGDMSECPETWSMPRLKMVRTQDRTAA